MKLILKKNNIEILVKELELNQEYIIGRGEDADILLDNEEGISRKHIKIYSDPEESKWILEVISAHKSLFLNEEEIDQVEIQNPATFTLKNYEIELVPKKNKNSFKSEESFGMTQSQFENTGHTSPLYEDGDNIYSLSITTEGEAIEYVDLDEGDSWVIGRDDSCDISIDHKHLTRRHFEIIKVGNQFKIKDLGSSNGTYLNGKKINSSQALSLKSEDVISVSDIDFTFEIRQKDFSKIIKNLPAVTEEEEDFEIQNQFAVPKVVIEEVFDDEFEESEDGFFNKKRIIMFSLVGIFLTAIFSYSFLENKKKLQSEKEKEKKMNEKSLLIQNHYALANRYLSQRKFQFCIQELEKLHKHAQFYQDSKSVLSQCQGALNAQKRSEEMARQEKQALETQAKVKKIIETCQSKADTFKTLDALNACLHEAVLIDPGNEMISSLQQDLQNKESLRQLKEQELESLAKMRKDKMAIYYRAKSLSKKGSVLQAVKVYKRFLLSVKNDSYFKKISLKASNEMNTIQNNYNETLSSLYTECENLIQEEKFKSAHSTCRNILKFEPNNKKAKDWIALAEKTLRDRFKQPYLDGKIQESIGRIEEAKKHWNLILKRDIKTGYYYKKAKIKLDKYK